MHAISPELYDPDTLRREHLETIRKWINQLAIWTREQDRRFASGLSALDHVEGNLRRICEDHGFSLERTCNTQDEDTVYTFDVPFENTSYQLLEMDSDGFHIEDLEGGIEGMAEEISDSESTRYVFAPSNWIRQAAHQLACAEEDRSQRVIERSALSYLDARHPNWRTREKIRKRIEQDTLSSYSKAVEASVQTRAGMVTLDVYCRNGRWYWVDGYLSMPRTDAPDSLMRSTVGRSLETVMAIPGLEPGSVTVTDVEFSENRVVLHTDALHLHNLQTL